MAFIAYGWRNYGTHNLTHTRAVCDHCGRLGYQRTYDASRWFNLYWIPLIPLGRKHVIGECPHCHLARQMSARQWRKFRETELKPALEAQARVPKDPDAAQKALATTVAIADPEAFVESALLVEQHLSHDPEVLTQMGRAYAYFRMDEEALGAFIAANKAHPTAASHAAVAIQLMEMGRVDEAASHVEQAATLGEPNQVAPLYLVLAEAHQALGDHAAALAALDALQAKFPDFNDANLPRLRALSEKNLKKNRKLTPGSITLGFKEPKAGGSVLSYAPLAILPLLIAGGLGIYAWNCAQTPPQHVYLIGGLDQSYDVLIDGRRVAVPAHTAVRIDVPYGQVQLAPAPDSLPIAPATVTIDVPWHLRAFEHPTIAINPDRAALILYEKVHYHEDLSKAGDPQRTFYTGQATYTFDNLDFRWQPLPETITTSTKGVWKSNVRVMDELSLIQRYVLLLDNEADRQAFRDALAEAIRLEPHRDDLLRFVPTAFGDSSLSVLEPLCAARPVNVQAHRIYSWAASRAGRDVEAEYRKLMEAEPGEGAWAYLLGRVVGDADEASALFDRAARAERPCAWGDYAQGHFLLATGRFREALAKVRAAQAALPNVSEFQFGEDEALLALGEYDELIERARQDVARERYSFEGYEPLVRYLRLSGDAAGANAAEAEALARIGTGDLEYAEEWRARFRRIEAEVTRDEAALLSLFDASDVSASRFLAAVLRGDAETAANLLAADAEPTPLTPYAHLLVYTMAQQKNLTDIAGAQLAAAAAFLGASDEDDRRLAAWLNGQEPPVMSVVHAGGWRSSERRVVLLALGARFPQLRGEVFPLAAKLNYNRDAQGIVVAKLLAASAPSP